LFVEELTKTVLETGHGAVDSIAAIPATLQDSLMARLDRLALGKEIAQICACIGREFSYSLIAAVADDDISDLNDALTKLIDAELLYQRGRPPNATYSFKHALVQETAYQSLLKTRQQQSHGRIAHALQTQFSEIVAAEPELMAYHYTQTGLNDQALPYWQLAGERAVQKSTHIESVYHFRAALDALQSIPENIEPNRQELNLQVALAVPLATTTGFASAEMEPVYQRARELCKEVGEAPLLRSRPNTALPTG
jgi:predicted ATPase